MLNVGCLEYQAQSPDEGALVSAARNFGFVFKVTLTLFSAIKLTFHWLIDLVIYLFFYHPFILVNSVPHAYVY